MTIDSDKEFLIAQRKPDRLGSLSDLIAQRPKPKKSNFKRRKKQQQKEEQWEKASTKSMEFMDVADIEDLEYDESGENESDGDDSDYEPPKIPADPKIKFINRRIASTLDRCNVSYGKGMLIVSAVANALGHDLMTYPNYA